MFKCNTIFITVLVLFSSWFRVDVCLGVCLYVDLFAVQAVCVFVVQLGMRASLYSEFLLYVIKSCIVLPKPPSCCPEGLILAAHSP